MQRKTTGGILMADFKLALNAGHYKGTAGKRVMKTLDPN